MDVDALFKALADPTRRQILLELANRDGQTLYELCVKLIMVRKFDMSRQAISKHLDALEEANLIETTWDGREKLHFINSDPLNKIQQWVKELSKTGRRMRS